MKSAIAAFGLCSFVLASAQTAAAGPPASYADNFQSYTTGDPINTQVAPSGEAWTSTPFVIVGEGPSANINGEGVVDATDLALMLGAWGGAGAADINESGIVDASDLALLLGAWGSDPDGNRFMNVDRSMPFSFIASVASTTFSPITVGAGETLSMRCDVYLESLDTYHRPGFRNFATGDIIGLAHLGGYHFEKEFGSFAPFTAADGRLERIAVFAPFDPNFRPVWAMTAKTAQVGEWFTLTFELTDSSYRVLIEDSETLAMFGPGPVEIFPAGPFGAAVNDFSSPVASPYPPTGDTVSSFFLGTGLDPSQDEVPGFAPTPMRVDSLNVDVQAAP